MSDLAIRVEDPYPERRRRMSKRYQMGARQKRHDTLRDQMADFGLQIGGFEVVA